MQWSKNEDYITGTHPTFELKSKLACFDLDGTLITTKSGRTFPVNKDDYKFIHDNVVRNIKNYHARSYCVVIISNQAGIKKNIPAFMEKIDEIAQKLDVPLKFYGVLTHSIYRKPIPTLFRELTKNITISSRSFYCGDAMGRSTDHSDCDIKFAHNCNIKFLSPEKFIGNKCGVPDIEYINLKIEKKEKLPEFREYNNTKHMILMVGFPGSGKSSLAKKIDGYIIVSNDIHKTKFTRVLDQHIKNGDRIIVDNTNPDKTTRKKVMSIAKKADYVITCINITTSRDLAYHNMFYRAFKNNVQCIPKIAYDIYQKKYEQPSIDEGFDKIISIHPHFSTEDKDYNLFFY